MARPAIGGRKVPITLTMDPRLLADVDARAAELEQTRSEIIREALRLWLDTQRQEAEVDRQMTRLAERRLADEADEWVSHDEVKARAGL